ncbi:MAG: DUF4249 family protein [Calditrichaeota bacterium]|nr:DUF4249 family protein [Calditrichota bacterium]MCB9365926.1 DUF4249 family protein [Calditrichota bacterium]
MKIFSYILLGLFSAMLFSACDDEADAVYTEELVVDGWMYIGHPLEIRLTHTIPVDQAYYPDQVRVSGASVFITVNGQATYELTEAVSGVPGTYALPESVHVVTTGDRYELLVALDGDTLRAATSAVAPLEITEAVLINNANVVTDPAPDTLEYGGDELRLSWTPSDVNFGYAILTEAMDRDKYGESCDFGDENGPGTYLAIWTERYFETQNVPWLQFCYTGPTMFRVFSCDTAGWDYIESTFIGDVTLDPTSNVVGGKGVFCAVGCDTFQVMVTDTLVD